MLLPSTGDAARLMGFGTAVRAKRKERGLTLEQLSERSKITPNYLGRIENEQVDPSLSVVLSIARALRASVSELAERGTDRGDWFGEGSATASTGSARSCPALREPAAGRPGDAPACAAVDRQAGGVAAFKQVGGTGHAAPSRRRAAAFSISRRNGPPVTRARRPRSPPESPPLTKAAAGPRRRAARKP